MENEEKLSPNQQQPGQWVAPEINIVSVKNETLGATGPLDDADFANS